MTLAFATVADLRLRVQDPNLDSAVAQAAIDQASGLIRSLARQTFDFVAGDVVELAGGDRVLVLPERPVVVDATHPLTVEILSESGQFWASTEGNGWYRQADRLIRRWPTQWMPQSGTAAMQMSASLWGGTPAPGVWPERVRVSYSHGYQSVGALPPGLQSLVLDTATALVSNPMKLRSEQVGGVAITWAAESMRSHASLVSGIKADLKLLGIRRGGVFSVGSY